MMLNDEDQKELMEAIKDNNRFGWMSLGIAIGAVCTILALAAIANGCSL